jgi:hypothetical protein
VSPSREVFFNIPTGWAVYLLLAALIALILYAVYRRVQYYLLGKPVRPFDQLSERLKNMLVQGLAQHRLQRDPLAGIMHICIFSSILVLTFVTAQVGLDSDILQPIFGISFLQGPYYLFYSFYGDLFGLIGLVGVGIALYIRYFHGRLRVKWYERWEDHAIILGLGLVLISGFVVEGARLAADELHTNPSWSPWSFVGFVLAYPFQNIDRSILLEMHRVSWWVHIPLAVSSPSPSSVISSWHRPTPSSRR